MKKTNPRTIHPQKIKLMRMNVRKCVAKLTYDEPSILVKIQLGPWKIHNAWTELPN